MNGATTRNLLAKIPTAGDGTVDPSWNPNANDNVNALAVSGSDVYAGGQFTTMNGATTRNRLAKIPAAGDGTVDPSWNPNASSTVFALAVSGCDVYAGGGFTTMNGVDDAQPPGEDPDRGRRHGRPELEPERRQRRHRAGGVGRRRLRRRRLHDDERRDDAQPRWRRSRPRASGRSTRAGTRTPTSTVNALAVSGSDVYAGGQLHDDERLDNAKPAGEDPDAGNGTVDPSWNPNAKRGRPRFGGLGLAACSWGPVQQRRDALEYGRRPLQPRRPPDRRQRLGDGERGRRRDDDRRPRQRHRRRRRPEDDRLRRRPPAPTARSRSPTPAPTSPTPPTANYCNTAGSTPTTASPTP